MKTGSEDSRFNQKLSLSLTFDIVDLIISIESLIMDFSTPSLPRFGQFPFILITDIALGYSYGILNHTNTKLLMTICAIKVVSYTFFFHTANYFFSKNDLHKHKVCFFTAAYINTLFFISLRELNLLGFYFSFLLGGAIAGDLIGRISYIQQEERKNEK